MKVKVSWVTRVLLLVCVLQSERLKNGNHPKMAKKMMGLLEGEVRSNRKYNKDSIRVKGVDRLRNLIGVVMGSTGLMGLGQQGKMARQQRSQFPLPVYVRNLEVDHARGLGCFQIRRLVIPTISASSTDLDG